MHTVPTHWDARRVVKLCLPVQDLLMRAHRVLPFVALALFALSTDGSLVSAAQPEVKSAQPKDVSTTPAEPKQDAEAFVLVEGQVTDHIGAGQEGVSITARRKIDGGGPGDVIATTTTDKLGDFVIRVKEPIRGDIVVTFSKPLYADLTRELHVGDDEFPPYLAEVLTGKLVLIGRVVDALTDKPVADALVTLEARYTDWRQKTDDQGRFTIKGVFPGSGELIVEAKGYGRQRQPVARMEDFGEIIVSVKPERVIHIKTVDDSGKPIAGVTVECYDQPRDDFRTAVTSEDGSVTFRGVHFDAAVLGVRLTHEGFVSSEGFDHEIVTPERKLESTHKLVMVRAGRITGMVTDASTGQPLNGARIITGDDYSDFSPRDWADYQGNYTITGVKPGRTTLTVHGSGYAPALKTVEVTEGGTAKLDFALSAGAVLTGVVKDKEGKPIPRAYVDATQWRGRSTLGLRAVSNENGMFTITDAPIDEFEIIAVANGYGEVAKTVKASPTETVEFILPPAPDTEDRCGRSGLKIGDPVPGVTLTTLDGKTFTLRELKGKTVLLDFWATWCAPCIEEMPQLIAVYERFSSRQDFVMIGISRDFDKPTLTRFLKRNPKLKWHHVFERAGGVETARKQFRVGAIPRVFLIGPDGKILATNLRREEIFKRVEQVMMDDES